MKLFKNLTKKHYLRYYSLKRTSEEWTSVVGLEVHAQINSKSKLFSGSFNKFSSPVNTNVSLHDCSTPGTLPVLNKRCIEAGVLTSLALNCAINPVSAFDRKHYFYADMPSGYQITQQRSPLANDGYLEFYVYTDAKKSYKTKVNIQQIQLEQDSGKSLHDDNRSLVDLNRAGAPLMELVFHPNLKDGEEAAALIKELTCILQRINTCTCKMEEGALRVDANVSIHKEGTPLGTRTEVKNISSVRGVAGAIKYEIERQIKIKESGGTVVNETRAWDAERKITVAMRDKEQMQDYRYMPEPNLPPLHVAIGEVKQGCVNVNDLKKLLPELPAETRQRLQDTLGLTLEQSVYLVNEPCLLSLFEQIMKKYSIQSNFVCNFLMNEFIFAINKKNLDINDFTLSDDYLGQTIHFLETGKINRHAAKILLEELMDTTTLSPIEIINARNMFQITSEEELTKLCKNILEENKKLVDQFKGGKTKIYKAILAIAAKTTDQRADMKKCDEILKKLLSKK